MEAAESPPKQRVTPRTTLIAIAGALALGAAAAVAWWCFSVVPARALLRKRSRSVTAIAKLYGLQLSYKRAHGTYANDLASLLSVDPDRAALKAALAANVDMNTLAVVGDANKFKIELNVLDSGRTLLRLKGPLAPFAFAAAPATPTTPTAPASPMSADGAPIIPSGR